MTNSQGSCVETNTLPQSPDTRHPLLSFASAQNAVGYEEGMGMIRQFLPGRRAGRVRDQHAQ